MMITIHFDGLCYPKNPCGVAAYGYLICRDGNLVHRGFGTVGEGRGMTNNVAEFEGLKAALLWLRDHDIKGEITIKGDSRLVIMQARGDWQVKSETSRRYVPEIQHLMEGLDVSLVWVSRDENDEADRLSRKAYEAYMKRKQGTQKMP